MKKISIRKLDPILNTNVPQTARQDCLDQTVKLLFQCVCDLKNSMKQLSLPNRDHGNIKAQEDIEERFENIKVDIPTIEALTFDEEKEKLQKWLGDLCRKVLSHGFKIYEAGKLNEKKVKVFCSENLIYNILELVRKNNLGQMEIGFINSCLKKDLFPYYMRKYPQSEESQVNWSLTKNLNEVDNFESNNNDEVFWSKVKFQYTESQDYNDEIMKFLNYIIGLPNQEMQNDKGEKIKVADRFFLQMENLFKKVEDEKQVQNMISWGKQDKKSLQKKFSLYSEVQQKKADVTKKQYEYAEQVRSYTKYSIGRKLSKNIQPFSHKQIKQENIKLDNPALMRIINKWCEQLQKNFDNIFNREQPFRMEDGNERFITKHKLYVLSKIMEAEKKKIKQKMKEIMKNNYQQQAQISKENFYSQLKYISDFENKVGIFSSFMFKHNKFYLLTYLNCLIHGLLTASKRFSKYLLASKVKIQSFKHIQDFYDECEKVIKENKYTLSEEHRKQTPFLITFKVGDLLRCKCSSKQYEILALFNQIQRVNHLNSEVLKIVRVKNRLAKGTKDILINFIYRKSMLVQMQLAINAEKSRFIECSDKFNHFLYEIKRSQSGPISELCNIWMTNDSAAEFYMEKTEEINNKMNIYEHQCKDNQEIQITLPFKCGVCTEYFASITELKGHKYCKSCEKNICIPCNIRKINTYSEMRTLFPALPEQNEEEKYQLIKPQRFVDDQIPDHGLSINLLEKKGKVKKFKKIIKDEKKYIFTFEEEQYDLLAEITNKNQAKNFLNNNIIIQTNTIRNLLESILNVNVSLGYLIPKMFKNSYKKEKQSIMINNEQMNDILLSSLIQKYQIFPKVRRINLMQNQVQDLHLIIKLFPYVETAILSFNKISQIPDDCQKLIYLKQLYLDKNRIHYISPKIKNLKFLRILNLENNSVSQEKPLVIPQEIVDMTNLQILNLDMNPILEIPKKIGNMKNLKQLIIKNLKKKQLPQSIGDCQMLEDLNLEFTDLQSIPSTIGDCKSLKKLTVTEALQQLPPEIGNCELLQELNLFKNKLEELPKQIGKLKNLTKLDIAQNEEIKELPKQIVNCKKLQILYLEKTQINNANKIITKFQNLKILNISRTKVQKLPENLHSLKNLVELNINSTNIKQLPLMIGDCESLVTLHLSSTKIERIPESIKNLKFLEYINLSKSPTYYLPQNLSQCENLKELYVKKTSLQKLPWSIGKLKDLASLDISETKIKQLPSSIGNCQNLQIFNAELCEIEFLPETFTNLKKLAYLNLKSTSIAFLPQNIFNCENLESIYLANSKIQRIDDKICDLNHLKALDLSNTFVQEIPQNIGNCKELQFLNFTNSKVKNLPQSLLQCSQMTDLLLQGTEIKELQKKMGHFYPRLQELNIKDTKIKQVPQSLTECFNLHLTCRKTVQVPVQVEKLITITRED